jgi:hypothetical protein
MKSDEVRAPAVAGQFYAGTEAGLIEQIESAFRHPIGPGGIPAGDGEDRPLAVVSPHAGYPYSGPVAAHGFARLARGDEPAVAVIVGPNHGRRGAPIAVSGASAWKTPLGTVPVHDGIRAQMTDFPGIEIDDVAHEGEHSLEVQVPFLQYLFEEVSIVPILMSRQDRTRIDQLTTALEAIEGGHRNAVLVASTDLTHYEPQDVAQQADRPILDAIEAVDSPAIVEASRSGHTMCGAGPTAAVLGTARTQGADSGTVLEYATSGDTAGTTDSVVGYVSASIP